MISGRLILIALCVCVNLLCSCSTQYKPVARNSLPPASASQLPPESTAHESFRHGFPFALTVRFGDEEEALFLVDTGCSKTTLDSSFEPSLGPCLGKEWVSALEGGNPLFSDRKSTRLNSSHLVISYAVFCLKKKKIKHVTPPLMCVN